jgi:predicted XRE-type DNA-binding protein
VKLRKVTVNTRKRQLELITRSGETYPLPFSRLDPRPSAKDPLVHVHVDAELAREGATYRLASGVEGVVLVDQALDYNSDPVYVTEMLVHRLTVEAGARLKKSDLSIREVARLLRTSVPQVYRLLDPANSKKSLAQLLSLLQTLDCDVEVIVKPRRRRSRPEARVVSRRAA